MDERLRLVARLLDGEKMAALCREFDVSRKTGYKIEPTTPWFVARYSSAQVLEFWLFFAVTSVAKCMTVHNSA
jgi:hypothetical protein